MLSLWDEYIFSLKNKGAEGAIWLADYDAYGIKPSISDSRIPIPQSEFTSSSLAFPVQGRTFKQAEIFVFGETFKQQLFDMVDALYDSVENDIVGLEEVEIKRQKALNWESVIFTIVGLCGPVGTAISLGQWSKQFAHGCAEVLCPPENMIVTKTNYLIYLNGLRNALNWYNPAAEPNRVLSIPIMCRVVSKTTSAQYIPFVGGPTMTTKTYLSYEPITNTQLFEYRENVIRAQSPSNPITGTVYPIVDSDSMEKALARETYDMSYETFNNNSQKTLSLSRGQYKWYKFKAPQNATYYFMSKGDEGTTIDIFGNMVYGKSDYGRVSRYYKNNGISTGVNFSLSLGEGQTIYLRVSGSNGAYSALSSTTLKISNTRFPSVFARINAFDLEVPMNLDNPFFFNSISVGNQYNLYVSSVGAFYNTDRDAIELVCDRDNNKPFAFLIMLFDRPIKEIHFGSGINNSYSYAHLGLYLQGLNQYGFPVTEDIAENYGNSYLLPCSVRYDDRDEAIYGVMFRIDPETDTSPYHVGYQEQLIGDFIVEFNDY